MFFWTEWEWEFRLTRSSHSKSCTLVGLNWEWDLESEWELAGLILPSLQINAMAILSHNQPVQECPPELYP
jgi:hypothetical protein